MRDHFFFHNLLDFRINREDILIRFTLFHTFYLVFSFFLKNFQMIINYILVIHTYFYMD